MYGKKEIIFKMCNLQDGEKRVEKKQNDYLVIEQLERILIKKKGEL